MTKKEFLVNAMLAFCVNLVSLLFVSKDTLFGDLKMGSISRGFPFHYTETVYGNSLFSSHILLFWVFLNLVFYFIGCLSVWFVIKSWLKNHNYKPALITLVLAVILFFINLFDSNGCVTGFPIRFYLKCTGVGSIGIHYILLGYTLNPLFWFCLSSIFISCMYWLKDRIFIKSVYSHKNVFVLLAGIWFIFFVIAILAIISNDGAGGYKDFVFYVFVILGFIALKKLRVFYKNEHQTRSIFFTKVGYLALGLGIGLIIISTIFNLTYTAGFFDFTDFGFYLISLPLSSILGFESDSDVLAKRLILYGISVLNVILISYAVDISSLIVKKTFLFVKDQFKKTQV